MQNTRIIQLPNAEVRVFPDATTLARAAADAFLHAARESISATGRFTVALSGGSTPKALLKLLADDHATDANLLPWRNLQKNIELPFEIKRTTPDHARIKKLLDRVGLAGFETKFPRELSGGMQQRASIVRSLSVDPSVLLMDEPFGALDAFTRDEMNLLIQEIWMETRKTICFVTHSITEAIFLADRVAVMSARPGRIAEIYDVDISRPRTVDIQTKPDFIERVLHVKSRIEHGGGKQAGLEIT